MFLNVGLEAASKPQKWSSKELENDLMATSTYAKGRHLLTWNKGQIN